MRLLYTSSSFWWIQYLVVFVMRNYDVEIYLMELINIISIGWHVNRHYLPRDFFLKKMKISGTEFWIFFTPAMSSF